VILHQTTFFFKKVSSLLKQLSLPFCAKGIAIKSCLCGVRHKFNGIRRRFGFCHVGSKSELFTGKERLFPILITSVGWQDGGGRQLLLRLAFSRCELIFTP